MSEDDFDKYAIKTEILFKPFEKIDLPSIVTGCQESWQNFSLCEVNDCVVRLGVITGDFHWHKHNNEEEFFYVIEGKLIIEFKDKTLELLQGQGCLVPKQVLHKTRAPVRTAIMMVEGKTVTATGD